MGYFSEKLKEHFKKRTPEQEVEDLKIVEKYKNIGPTIEEYFNSIEQSLNPEFKAILKRYRREDKELNNFLNSK